MSNNRSSLITSIEVLESRLPMKDLGKDREGISVVYKPGTEGSATVFCYRVHTESGISGEYVGGDSVGFAQFRKLAPSFIGLDALERELIYDRSRRELRKYDKMGMGPFDIALWDFAGKYFDAPISKLLGGWRKRLPCYASTMSGDRNGGLDSPEAFAEFAIQCKNLGYPAFKLHIWDDYTITELVKTIHLVRDAVGPEMGLMLDPACKLQTFLEALQVARACDEAGFLWMEDPYKDGGVSIPGHARLSQLTRTPLLQSEHVHGPEEKANFVIGGGTHLIRVDAEYDGGITGALKIAHFAEAMGLDVEIHSPSPAHRHLMSAIRNTNYYEMALVHPLTPLIGRPQDIYSCDYKDGLEVVDSDGCVTVPQGPGLGVIYDWDLLTHYKSMEYRA